MAEPPGLDSVEAKIVDFTSVITHNARVLLSEGLANHGRLNASENSITLFSSQRAENRETIEKIK
jgi:hypothetical protein